MLPGDTEETLHERIKVAERTLYPATVAWALGELEAGSEIEPPAADGRVGGDHAAADVRQTREEDRGDDVVRALLSVYDKEGLVELAQGLSDLGWELVASGNTSAKLTEAGIAHLEVAQVTGSPEMLGGRVKTLHPKIHGGILADRSKPEHLDDLAANGIEAIDLVVSNLYPFSSDPSIELIDIGGPAMVRAAAKNHEHVGHRHLAGRLPGGARGAARLRLAVGGDAAPAGPGGLRPHRRLRRGHRRLARRRRPDTGRRSSAAPLLPTARRPSCPRSFRRRCTSRSSAPRCCATARTRTSAARATAWRARRVGGTPWSSTAGSALSYLNLFDGDAAWRLVHELAGDAGRSRRRWPSSSTPTRAAPPWPATSSPPTSGRSSATCRAPSAAWSPSAVTSPPRWPTPSPPGRRPT